MNSNELFGKCPVCQAIVSLDATCNVKCDACDDYLDEPTPEPIVVEAAGKRYQWRWTNDDHQYGHWYQVDADGTERLYKTSDLFEQLLISLVEKQQLEITKLKEDVECFEGMKEGVQIRIADLEEEVAALTRDRERLESMVSAQIAAVVSQRNQTYRGD
jgi:hypothetical protein